MATGSYDCTLKIWDPFDGNCIAEKKDNGYVFCLLEFENDMILSGTSENNIGLWNLSSNNDTYEYNFIGHRLWVNCLIKYNNQIFVSASNDANIIFWNYYKKIIAKTILIIY